MVTQSALLDMATLRLLTIRESLRLMSGGFFLRTLGGVIDLKTTPRGTDTDDPDTMAWVWRPKEDATVEVNVSPPPPWRPFDAAAGWWWLL